MGRINQDSITDQVYRILHRAIDDGRFKPGARIYEHALAQELGTSKTPLRVALHQLKRDGVIRIEARKGIYLAVPTRTEVIELIELREVLEGLAARRAALQPGRQFVKQLEACLSGFEERNLAKRRLDYAAADHRFHTLLAQAAGSSELAKTLQGINIRLHQYRINHQTSGHDLRPIHRQHLGIVRALQAGDASLSEELARKHVRHQLALRLAQESQAGAHADKGPSASPGDSSAPPRTSHSGRALRLVQVSTKAKRRKGR